MHIVPILIQYLWRAYNFRCSRTLNWWFFVGGRRISNLRCANDTTLIASDEEEMAELVNLVKIASEELGLRINASKIKVMVVHWAKCLLVSTALSEYEKVNALVYLGSIIRADGGSSAEIQRRIALSKSAMTRLRNVSCNNKIF